MRRSVVFLLVVITLGASAVPAGAVLRGENGLILFTSGRNGPDNDDSQAKLYLADVSGIVSISPALTPLAGQHHHASWSPDRTKIVYARGTPGSFATEAFDIYVQDMTTGVVTPITDTGDNLTADHPAWSPDGESIAYEEEITPNNTGQRDIWIENGANGGRVNLTQTAGTPEHKPAWDPFSRDVYFNVGDPGAANALNIAKRPADLSSPTGTVLGDAGVSEFQPSISPDGLYMCWTEGSGFNASAEIMVGPVNSPGTNKVNLTDDNAVGDYNCTWSPEGDEIAYVKGTFTTGRLMRTGWPDDEFDITVTDDPMNFDGNPDWAPDGRPTCPDVTVKVTTGSPVTIPVECTDTGPAFEQSEVREFPGNEGPRNGTVTQENIGEPLTYTPDAGFIGADTFTYSAFDRGGFVDSPGRILINVEALPVAPGPGPGPGPGGGGGGPGGGGPIVLPPPPPPLVPCAGRVPTITGTQGADTIRGTARRDVIVALSGNDTILGAGGSDVICGGDGNDTLSGGAGPDRIFGERGNDRLNGGAGRDRLSGGAGRDRLFGNGDRDTLLGGAGVDLLRGGAGRDIQRQ